MGPIRRRFIALVVVAAMGAGALAAAGVASGSAYRTFPTCLLAPSPSPDHSCFEGDGYGAVFIARHRAHIHYRLCFRPPGRKKRCVRKETHQRREPSEVGLYGSGGTHAVGTWRLKWKHAGHIVDRDRLHVGSEGV
jgi:hypothetical protein